ncbi:OmpW family outer membrane protein [Oryzisolibacter sp. LB2S]|uniref:OmpW/AlkL family protein n=1 Tax=Alicycliphilus soli TaxID=3228789 RepID=UPI00345B2B67
MSRKFSHALTGAALLALCTAASAQWTVRGGLTHIAPHSSATDAVGPMLPGPPSGISIKVKDKATLFLSVAYGLNPNMELELALGYPPTHDVTAKIASSLPPHIAAFNGQKVAEVRQIAPTLFFNYKFGDASSQWRPFVGVGLNYTNFDKRKSTAANNALNGGPTDIRLTDSWGLAGQVGLSYRINDRWSITGALATARVKSRLTTHTAGVQRQIDIRFHPVVLTINAGYTF